MPLPKKPKMSGAFNRRKVSLLNEKPTDYSKRYKKSFLEKKADTSKISRGRDNPKKTIKKLPNKLSRK